MSYFELLTAAEFPELPTAPPAQKSLTKERLSGAIDSYQSNLYGLGEAVSGALGFQDVQNFMRAGRQDNEAEAEASQARARALGGIDSYKDVNSVGTGLNYVGGLAAQSLPYMAEMLIPGAAVRYGAKGLRGVIDAGRAIGATEDAVAAGRAASRALAARQVAAGAAGSYPSAVGDILSNQRDQLRANGIDDGQTDLLSAGIGGVPYAALNGVLGIGRAASTLGLARRGPALLDKATGLTGGLVRTGATVARTGFEEGGSETGQEFINQYFGRMAVDPNEAFANDKSIDRFKESFVGGGALGGVFGAVGGHRRSEQFYKQQEDAKRAAIAAAAEAGRQADLLRNPAQLDGPEEFGLRVRSQFDSNKPLAQKEHDKRQAEYEALLQTPTGRTVVDSTTGVERPETYADLVDRVSDYTPPVYTQQRPLFSPDEAPLSQYTPPPTDPVAGTAPDTATRDMLVENPSAMTRTMFNPPVGPQEAPPSGKQPRGAVAQVIRAKIARALGDDADANMAVKLSIALANSVGDLPAMQSVVQSAQAAVEKSLKKLDRLVSDGSNMLEPQEYQVRRDALDKKLLTIMAAQDIVDQYRSAFTQDLAQEGLQKARPGAVVGQAPVSDATEQFIRAQNADRELGAAIAETDRRVQQGNAERSRETRLEIVREVMATTRNRPVQKIVAAFKRAGYQDTNLSREEHAEVRRIATERNQANRPEAPVVIKTPPADPRTWQEIRDGVPLPAPTSDVAPPQTAVQAPQAPVQPTQAPQTPAASVATQPKVKAAQPAPKPSASPGQQFVERVQAQTGKTVSPEIRSRVFARMGMDKNGYPVLNKLLAADTVAAMEARQTGAKAVTRQGVSKSLDDAGFTRNVMAAEIDRLIAQQNSRNNGIATVEVDENALFADPTSAEDTTPTSSDETAFDATAPKEEGTTDEVTRESVSGDVRGGNTGIALVSQPNSSVADVPHENALALINTLQDALKVDGYFTPGQSGVIERTVGSPADGRVESISGPRAKAIVAKVRQWAAQGGIVVDGQLEEFTPEQQQILELLSDSRRANTADVGRDADIAALDAANNPDPESMAWNYMAVAKNINRLAAKHWNRHPYTKGLPWASLDEATKEQHRNNWSTNDDYNNDGTGDYNDRRFDADTRDLAEKRRAFIAATSGPEVLEQTVQGEVDNAGGGREISARPKAAPTVTRLKRRVIPAGVSGETGKTAAGQTPAAQKTRFRQTDRAPVGSTISRSELEGIVAQVQREIGNGVEITVLEDASGLDGVSQDLHLAGATIGNTVYLFRSGIVSGVDGMATVFHELFHKGLRALLPDSSYFRVMNTLYRSNETVREAADKWIASAEGQQAKKDYAEQYPNQFQRDAALIAHATDEALARVAEKLKTGDKLGTGEQRALVRSLAKWLATVADTLGMRKLAQRIRAMTYNKVEAFVQEAIDASVQGRQDSTGARLRPGTTAFAKWFGDSKVVDADGNPLVVYHGTASDFTEFKLTRSGEFGPAIYTTDNPREAGEYGVGQQKPGVNVMPVFVSIKNPYIKGPDQFWKDFNRDDGDAAAVRRAQEAGFDGVITTRPDTYYDNTTRQFVSKGDVLTHYIAFSPTQIKSAIGNNGNYDPTNPDIRYRTSAADPTDVEANTSVLVKAVDYLRYDVIGKARRGVLSSTFLRDIGARYDKKLPRITEYVDGVFAMGAMAAELQKKAKGVQDALNALPSDQKDAVIRLMGNATAGRVVVEPANGRNNTHLDADGMALAVKLHNEFKAMTPAQQAAYHKTRNALWDNWKLRGELLQKAGDDIYDPLIANAAAAGNETQVRQIKRQKRAYIDEINARLAQIKGDYFPMMRFGPYMVVRKSAAYIAKQAEVESAFTHMNALLEAYDKNTPEGRKLTKRLNKALEKLGEEVIGDFTPEQSAEIAEARNAYHKAAAELDQMKGSEKDYYMERFETEAAAQREKKANGGTLLLAREFHKELNPISRDMLRRMEESLSATLRENGNETALRDAKKAMYEVFLSSLPEQSALKRQKKRMNVAGFSRDMQRSIADSMFKDSFYLSRLKHMDDLTAALNSVAQQARDSGDTKLQEVSAELDRRHAASMKYDDTPIQDALAATTYVYMLGVSPGFLISNLLQPFMVSMPMLIARHGFKANKEFGRAYADVARIVSKSIKENPSGDISYDKAGLTDGEVAMLDEMLRQQLLQITLTKELSQASAGRSQSAVMRMISLPSHHVEVINRIGTALAAYRLEVAKTNDVAGATKYAQKVLADTHFDYSAENAQYWMKPGVVKGGKLFFQFKKYQLGMISLWVKNIAALSKKELEAAKASGDSAAITAAETKRSEAKKMLLGMLVTHGAMAGALGAPAVGSLLFMANLIASAFGDDEPWDSEAALRNFLHDLVGKTAGDVLAKGLPTLLDADLSRKIGQGAMLSVAPNLRTDKVGRDMYMELVATALGPTIGGLGGNLYSGVSAISQGNLQKGVEYMLPKFIADPLRAGRFATDGVTTGRGAALVRGEDVGAWDAFLQASGIPSLKLSDAYGARSAIENKKLALDRAKSDVSMKWADARQNGDSAKAAELWAKIRNDINPARRKAGVPPITYSDLLRYAQQRKATEAQYKRFGGRVGRNTALAEEGRFARN